MNIQLPDFDEDEFAQQIAETIAVLHDREIGVGPRSRRFHIFKEKKLAFDIAYFVKWGQLPAWTFLDLPVNFWRRRPLRQGKKVIGNLFIQFKLAKRYRSSPGGHWSHWGRDHFFAKLIHKGKDKYLQQQILKRHASKGYATYWAANTVLKTSRLDKLKDQRRIFDMARFIPVSATNRDHDEVSFTKKSKEVHFDSEPETIDLVNYAELFTISEMPFSQLREDLAVLCRELKESDTANDYQDFDQLANRITNLYVETRNPLIDGLFGPDYNYLKEEILYNVYLDYLYRYHKILHISH